VVLGAPERVLVVERVAAVAVGRRLALLQPDRQVTVAVDHGAVAAARVPPEALDVDVHPGLRLGCKKRPLTRCFRVKLAKIGLPGSKIPMF